MVVPSSGLYSQFAVLSVPRLENGICRIYLRQPQSGGGVKSAVISFIVIISVLLWKVTRVFLHLAAVKIGVESPSKSTVGVAVVPSPYL